MKATAAGVAAAGLAILGCSGDETRTAAGCADCRPVFETVVELDFDDAPTGLRSTVVSIAIAPIPNSGGWLVAIGSELLRFDDTGRFVASIGRPGEGPPPDHGTIEGLAFDAADSLLLADSGNQRIDVYAPDLTPVRSVPVTTPLYHFDLMADGRAVIAGMTPAPPHYDRFRARIIDRDGVESPAAEMEPLESRHDQMYAFTPLTAADGFWMARPFEYTVLRYDLDGTLVDSVVRAPSWFVPADFNDETYALLGIEEDRPSITALMTDSANRLWTQATIFTASDSLPDPALMTAQPRTAVPQLLRAVFDYAIEAVDARTGVLLASEILRGDPTHFIGDGYGYQLIEDAATGAIDVRIVRFDIER